MALGRLALLKSDAFTAIGVDTDYDEVLKALLEAATAILNDKCGRELALAAYTDEMFEGTGAKFAYLKEYPVRAVTEVRVASTSAVVDSAHYELRELRYMWYEAGGLNAWQRNLAAGAGYDRYSGGWLKGLVYAVDYEAGYDDSGWDSFALSASGWNVPRDLEMACCALAEWLWKQGKVGGAQRGLTGASSGPESANYVQFIRGLPTEVEAVINHYRRVG